MVGGSRARGAQRGDGGGARGRVLALQLLAAERAAATRALHVLRVHGAGRQARGRVTELVVRLQFFTLRV